MAFEKSTRDRLRDFVADARNLLTEEFTRQMQNDYGINPANGTIDDLSELPNLDDTRRETARILRETLEHYAATSPNAAQSDLLDRIVREQAFTVLNRLAALRMAESRGFLIESLGSGYSSKGFQLYQRVAGTGLGEIGDIYRTYIFSLFDEFSLDLKVLFDRFSPFGRLFPRETALLELLELINHHEIAPLWAEDETVGWIYQYFNSKDERKKMRDESSAPRNSRELAVRNQFFTPRYVVEFLTDNTLGRTWYEMTKGETALVENCRYLVRRPNEVFLDKGETAPEQTEETNENLSQEELLKQPFFVPHREMKDPREILMLDPACGSMHFGLYAFDLFLTIYEEAWDLEEEKGADVLKRSKLSESLHEKYKNDRDKFLRDVPRLIVVNNIHGVDIDPRAVQIAGLSLWLRAQRAWAERGVKPLERPQIRKSNIVCAEPMPGEADLLEEFIARHFSAAPEKRVLGEFIRRIFDSMRLAGEAGSLLKIEEEVAGLIRDAKEQWNKLQEKQAEKPALFDYAPVNPQQNFEFELGEITDAQFWDRAETDIYQALRRYSEAGEDGAGYNRRLFADDAAQGFAFIDLCRKRFDIALMNPPFGLATAQALPYIQKSYTKYVANELGAVFYDRVTDLLVRNGFFGEISSRTCFFLNSLSHWRINSVFQNTTLKFYFDLGQTVLDDAMNETACYIAQKGYKPEGVGTFGMFHEQANKQECLNASNWQNLNHLITTRQAKDFDVLPDKPLCYWVSREFINKAKSLNPFSLEAGNAQMGLAPRDEFRFSRLWWEVIPEQIGLDKIWTFYAKGGELSAYYSDVELVLNAKNDLAEIKAALNQKYPYLNGNLQFVLHPENNYFEAALTFGQRTTFLRVSVLPAKCYFSVAGKAIFGEKQSPNSLLQSVNTLTTQFLVSLRRESFEMNPQYQEGDVNRMPWADFSGTTISELENIGLRNVDSVRQIFTFDELDHLFICFDKAKNLLHLRSDAENRIEQNESFADKLLQVEFNLAQRDAEFIERELSSKWRSRRSANWFSQSNNDEFHYWLGCIFGRWDVRFATGEKSAPELPDPFAPLPVCPPGMLQNADGLPAAPSDVPADYPLDIVWNGILVDDAGHRDDVENRLRDVLQVIWKDRAEAIETEACEILGVRTLRDYFRKPSGFFADHLKRYSKSRRQAPIYLPLSTRSGEYTLWLYYHRLTDQTLYTSVNDYVEPKLKAVQEEANILRAKPSRTTEEEKRFEKSQNLAFELEEFRDELLRLAPIWKPNLNDGVQITMSPLWKLFGLAKWQKTLKETWQKLEKGDYDWAHLAYSLYPERVEQKCIKDKSLAIAHDREDLYIEPPPKIKKKKVASPVIQTDLDGIED